MLRAAIAVGRLILVTVTVACVAGCPQVSYEPRGLSEELEPLYERVRDYRHDYEEAIELIVAGDVEKGRELLATATQRIGVVSELCARTEGCDASLFVDAIGQVYRERSNPRPKASGTARDSRQGSPGTEALPGPSPSTSTGSANGQTAPSAFGSDLQELIPLNSQVKSALNDWLTWDRPTLMETYRNYHFLREKLVPIYQKAGLPEALLFAIMATESGGKAHVYSRAGAAGPLQFMRHTGKRYGLGSVEGFDMRLDPEAATRASVAYLKDQLKTFDNDVEKMLAAYNFGETRIRRLDRKHAQASFWDPEIYYAVPTETRLYVPRVMAATLLFLQPEEYGLEFPDSGASTTSIVLEEDISLGELSVCLGRRPYPDGWFRTLRNLNPRIRPSTRVKAGGTVVIPLVLLSTYAEQCLGGTPIMGRARDLHEARFPDKPTTVPYTVRRGDTLAAIAARYRCSLRKLASVNGISGPNYVINVGQRLTIPHRS